MNFVSTQNLTWSLDMALFSTQKGFLVSVKNSHAEISIRNFKLGLFSTKIGIWTTFELF